MDVDRKLPARAWRRIRRITTLVITGSVAVSVLLTHLILETFSGGLDGPGLTAAIVMPLVLGGPAAFFLTLREAQLRHANEQLEAVARTDWLTGCLSRRAFTMEVARRLSEIDPASRPDGALLLIDADNFKSVNDRFGHQAGDVALRLIAGAVRDSLRGTDLVGRVGGEEFCIFLPGVSAGITDIIAERVREAVAALDFAPGGEAYPLSVSIGGATFNKPAGYDQLYRLADERLYAAKNNGRDRVALMHAA